MKPFALFGRVPKGVGGLPDVVLLELRFGEGGAELEGLVARHPRLLQRAHEQRCGLGAMAVLQGIRRLGEGVGQRHGRQYTGYTGGWIGGFQQGGWQARRQAPGSGCF